jgi:uncharacterized glyoxalase superfamily protein PhnB
MDADARQTIFPAIRYGDADAAIAWLEEAFGCAVEALHRDDTGAVAHAELRFGGGLIMIGEYSDEGWLGGSPPDAPASTVSLYLVVDDPDAHHARAVAAGARIVRDLVDQPYGSREYSARDLEGNLWSFGTYDPNRPDG